MKFLRATTTQRDAIRFGILFVLALYGAYLIRNTLILFFLAFIIMSALSPMAGRLTKVGVPKVVSALIVFILSLALVVGLISAVLIPFFHQLPAMAAQVVIYAERLLHLEWVNAGLIQQELSRVSDQAFSLTLSAFETVFGLISLLVISVYMLSQRDLMYEKLPKYFDNGERVKKELHIIETKLGAWLRGQMLVALIVGLAYYAILSLLNVPFALPLAVLGAMFEFIPILGPFLAFVPAFLIGLTISPFVAGMIALTYFVVQAAESHLLVPLTMNKAVGLNPLLIIFAISVGGTLFGITGILLAVPITAVIQIVVEEKVE